MAVAKLGLAILVAAFLSLAGTGNGDCEYQLKVKTMDWPSGGTEGTVHFELYDESRDGGPVVKHEEDGAGAKFNRGRTDEFTFTDPECIRPCRLVLNLDESFQSFADGWFCESVDVTVSGDDNSYFKSFEVDQLVQYEDSVEIDECTDAAV